MLYDRPYMKSTGGLFNRSTCDQLIIFLIICFVLQALLSLFLGTQSILQTFAFGFQKLSNGFIWTFFTYGFIHDGPLHLIINLLGIHFIGRPVEEYLGHKKFKYLIVFSLFMGALTWLFFNSSDYQHLMGSSAIVLSFLCFFCLHQPNQPITLLLFFILPITIKPKWVLLGTFLLELYGLLTSEISDIGGIAHSAHLGGMLCGAIMFFSVSSKLFFPFRFKFTKSPNFIKKAENPLSASRSTNKYRVNFGKNSSIKDETDRILDKINEKGFGSLTRLEKETLEKAKKLLEK